VETSDCSKPIESGAARIEELCAALERYQEDRGKLLKNDSALRSSLSEMRDQHKTTIEELDAIRLRLKDTEAALSKEREASTELKKQFERLERMLRERQEEYSRTALGWQRKFNETEALYQKENAALRALETIHSKLNAEFSSLAICLNQYKESNLKLIENDNAVRSSFAELKEKYQTAIGELQILRDRNKEFELGLINERNVASDLKRQLEKTEILLNLQQEKAADAARAFREEADNASLALTKEQTQKAKLETVNRELRAEIDSLSAAEREQRRLLGEHDKTERKLMLERESANELRRQLTNLKEKITRLENDREDLKATNQRISDETADLRETIAKQKHELRRKEDDCFAIAEERDAIKAQLQKAKASPSRAVQPPPFRLPV
jgi:chromosome segregation ATPase